MNVTLQCKAGGHFWDRPAQRGRKPLLCPEHAAAARAAAEDTPRSKRKARRRAPILPILGDAAAPEGAAYVPLTLADLTEWWSIECANPAACVEHAVIYREQLGAIA